MTTAEIIVTALCSLSPIVSVAVAIIVARRNKDKSVKSDGQKEGVLQSDVGYIKSGVDRLEKRLDKMDEKSEMILERVAKLEATVDSHIQNKSIHRSSTGDKKNV